MIAALFRALGVSPWALLAILLAAGGVISGAYLKGRSDANANCRAAELQAKVEALQRDLKVQREADAFEAAALRELEADNAQKDMEIELYVKKLAERPVDIRCLLDDLDLGVDGLHTFGPR